jgi:dGTPase
MWERRRPGKKFKTVECEIMDLADDIAYSTYDLEDAMKAGFSHPLGIRARLVTDQGLVDRVHKKVRKVIPDATWRDVFKTLNDLFDLGDLGPVEAEAAGVAGIFELNYSNLIASQGYLRVGFTSSLVNKFINGITVKVPARGKEKLQMFRSIERHALRLNH